LNPDDMPTAYAIQQGDTITASLVDTLSGYFLLGFLPEGEYAVSVSDTNGLSFNQDGIQVIVGDDYDLGELTLE